MAELDFTHTPLSRLGSFFHWLLGPSYTAMSEGPSKTRMLIIPSTDTEEWPKATIRCTRIVYRTTYERWWVPTVHRTLYVVAIDVDKSVTARHGSEPFESVTYPLLCNRFLKWTTYPHLCAILAFLDNMLGALGKPQHPRNILL